MKNTEFNASNPTYLFAGILIIAAMVFFVVMTNKSALVNQTEDKLTHSNNFTQSAAESGATMSTVQQKLNYDCNVHYENLLTLLSIYLFNKQHDFDVDFKEVLSIKNALREDNQLFITTAQEILN